MEKKREASPLQGRRFGNFSHELSRRARTNSANLRQPIISSWFILTRYLTPYLSSFSMSTCENPNVDQDALMTRRYTFEFSSAMLGHTTHVPRTAEIRWKNQDMRQVQRE